MVEAAWWFRRQSHALVRRLARDPRWETWLAVSPDREGMESRVWPANLRRWPQGRGDLGDRMARVFRRFPAGAVAIIGADIPDISPKHIAAAFQALGQADAVFGPAADGGYWLIGLSRGCRAAPAGLFRNVRWSSPNALADTVASLGRAQIAYIDTLGDVDTAADL
jgi:glycosyltransferase A (GT-A) superfamily protein (DUF2064 family)